MIVIINKINFISLNRITTNEIDISQLKINENGKFFIFITFIILSIIFNFIIPNVLDQNNESN